MVPAVTSPDDADGFRLVVDYDDARWALVPDPEVMAASVWASRSAKAWADDLGRHDRNWETVLRLMLEQVATQPYRVDPDAVLAHVLTPADEAPDVAIAVLLAVPSDGQTPAELAQELSDSYAPQSIEPPSVQEVTLSSGLPALLVTVHLREQSNTVQTQARVIWQLHPAILVTLTASADDIGRILVMRDDMVALAGRVSLELAPIGEP